MFFRSALCVTRGLVAFSPLIPPAYVAAGVKAYLIITETIAESVRPSSEGSVFAGLPFAYFEAENIDVCVTACPPAVSLDPPPAATPVTTTLRRATNANDASNRTPRRCRGRVVLDT